MNQFKTDSKSLYLGDISKYFTIKNMKITYLFNRVHNLHDFSVDYNNIDTSYILDIHI